MPPRAGMGEMAITMIKCPICNGKGRIAPEALSIGQRFRMERGRLGMIQAEMAAKLQIGRAQLANIEGDRSKPGLEVLVRAADAMGVSVDRKRSS